jgi:hypothetical protein
MALEAVEAGGGSFSWRIVRGELVAALFASVPLALGARIAPEFPEEFMLAAGACWSGCGGHVFPFDQRAGTVLANMNRNPLYRKDLVHSFSVLLR